MTRTLALALAASALIAGPAAADTTRINVAGKSPEQIAKDVWAAAQRSCLKREGAITMIEAHRACVTATYREALAKSGDSKVAAVASMRPES